jgi:hypothetical protein
VAPYDASRYDASRRPAGQHRLKLYQEGGTSQHLARGHFVRAALGPGGSPDERRPRGWHLAPQSISMISRRRPAGPAQPASKRVALRAAGSLYEACDTSTVRREKNEKGKEASYSAQRNTSASGCSRSSSRCGGGFDGPRVSVSDRRLRIGRVAVRYLLLSHPGGWVWQHQRCAVRRVRVFLLRLRRVKGPTKRAARPGAARGCPGAPRGWHLEAGSWAVSALGEVRFAEPRDRRAQEGGISRCASRRLASVYQ